MRSLLAASATLMMIALLGMTATATGGDRILEQSSRAQKHALASTAFHHKDINARLFAELHQLKAMGHAGFAAQQSTTILNPASDATQCTDGTYSAAVLGAFTACITTEFPIGETYNTDALAKTAFDTFCASTCFSGLKTSLEGTNFEVCMQPELKFVVKSTAFFCGTKSTTGGEVCGVTYNRMTRFASCDSFPVTTSSINTGDTKCSDVSDVCETASTSVMVANTSISVDRCRSVYSTSVAASVCDGGCVPAYVKLIQGVLPGSDLTSGLAVLDNLLCSKDTTGAYCTATMSATRNAFESNTASTTTFDSMCASKDILLCYRRVLGFANSVQVQIAKKTFQFCAVAVMNVSAAVNVACVPRFKNAMREVKVAQQRMGKLCTKNAAGTYCIFHEGSVSVSPCFQYSQNTLWRMNCTTLWPACAAALDSSITSMGCCAGLLQEAYTQAGVLAVAEYPKVTGYTPTASGVAANIGTSAPVTLGTGEEAVTVSSGSGYLADAAFCGATGLNMTLSKRCILSTTTVAKKLGLKIKWSVLAADEALMAKIHAAVRLDVSNNLGVGTEALINDKLVQNSAISVSTTARRAFAMQAAGSGAGTNYEFEIQGADEASTDAASASFDNMETENSFLMTETQSTTTEECGTSCTDSSSASLTTSTTSSGAAATFAGAVVVVVTLVASLI